MENRTSCAHIPRIHSPQLLILLALIGFVGGVALVAGNIIGSIVVPGHDWVSDTVSDLAAGKYEIIQDVALYGYAGTLFALALATAHLHGGSWRWSALTLVLVLIAVFVVIIGARNEYGDGDSEGIVIHIYIVYAMGVAFVIGFVLAALLYREIAEWFSRASWVAAALWVVGAPIFFMMPTAYDGAWERGLGVVSMLWTSGYAWLLWRMARQPDAGKWPL
tara:strand:+ start:93 stop:752 length:660 start_codon:yes stop_codon:yes gene_type:complete